MGRSSKQKGGAYERRVVADHHESGVVCHKIPLSGAMEGYKGDLKVCDDLQGEVKARKKANGFKVIKEWLGDNDLLFLQEIGNVGEQVKYKPIVAMPWRQYVVFIRVWERARLLPEADPDTVAILVDQIKAILADHA